MFIMNNFWVHTTRTDGFHEYLKVNYKQIQKLVALVSRFLDSDSQFQLNKFLKLFQILPNSVFKKVLKLKIPETCTFLSDEEKIILANHSLILDEAKLRFSMLNTENIKISLQHHYFDGGLKEVPLNVLWSQSDSVCCDLGAYNGDSTLSFLLYPFYKIYAFEPDMANFKLLSQFVNKNNVQNRVQCCQLAVSDKNEMCTFSSSGEGSGLTSSGDVTTETITLDAFFENKNEKVGCIKMDIEGEELNALFGAKKIIMRDKPILLISAYHVWLKPLQLFEILLFIKKLNLDYTIKFKCLQPDTSLVNEFMVIAYCESNMVPFDYLDICVDERIKNSNKFTSIIMDKIKFLWEKLYY